MNPILLVLLLLVWMTGYRTDIIYKKTKYFFNIKDCIQFYKTDYETSKKLNNIFKSNLVEKVCRMQQDNVNIIIQILFIFINVLFGKTIWNLIITALIFSMLIFIFTDYGTHSSFNPGYWFAGFYFLVEGIISGGIHSNYEEGVKIFRHFEEQT